MVSKLRFYFIKYYYLLVVFVGFTQMLRIQGGWTILCYLSCLFALTVLGSIRYHICDVLVFSYIAYSLITYPLFGDYPVDIYISSIRDQFFPISFYFFARSSKTKDIDIFQTSIIPLMVAYIIGFFLFFSSPGWYIDYIMDGDWTNDVTTYYNRIRMSSFWSSGYFVGYSSLFVILYVINKSFFLKQTIKHSGIILAIAILSLFFAQQRVSIVFALLYMLMILCVSIKRRKVSLRKVLLFIFGAAVLVGVIALLLSKYTDKYYLEWLIEHYTEHEDGMVQDRIKLFEKYISSISLMGDGFGKYSHNALFYDLPSITDCEYIRMPNEIGIFGLCIFLLIMIPSLVSNIIKGKIYSFETMIVLFYSLAMVGATPLEVSQHQPFVLWYCLGRMHNK